MMRDGSFFHIKIAKSVKFRIERIFVKREIHFAMWACADDGIVDSQTKNDDDDDDDDERRIILS